MSRTDKDAPHWVRAEYYEPYHDWTCPDRIARSWQHYHRSSSACTLPAQPVRSDTRRRSWRSPRTIPETPECYWIAEWPTCWRYNYSWGPRSWDRHCYWWGPDRANVRVVLAKAKQQYNGCGEVDIIEPTRNHRHAMYSGGWWD